MGDLASIPNYNWMGMHIFWHRLPRDFYGRMVHGSLTLGGACVLTIITGAFIRDVPNIVWAVEKVVSGEMLLTDSSTRVLFVTHLLSKYLRPIAVNLGRGLLLVLIGTLLINGFLTFAQNISRTKGYRDYYNQAAEHWKQMHIFKNQLALLMPSASSLSEKDVYAYLGRELNYSEEQCYVGTPEEISTLIEKGGKALQVQSALNEYNKHFDHYRKAVEEMKKIYTFTAPEPNLLLL